MKASDMKKAFRGVGTMLLATFVLLNGLMFQSLIFFWISWIILLFGVAQIWTAFCGEQDKTDQEKEFNKK